MAVYAEEKRTLVTLSSSDDVLHENVSIVFVSTCKPIIIFKCLQCNV